MFTFRYVLLDNLIYAFRSTLCYAGAGCLGAECVSSFIVVAYTHSLITFDVIRERDEERGEERREGGRAESAQSRYCTVYAVRIAL